MVAMVCGMVLSSILLVILLAMVCWKWYAHCLAYYFFDKFSLSLSSNVAGDISDAHASVIPPLSPLQIKSIHFS